MYDLITETSGTAYNRFSVRTGSTVQLQVGYIHLRQERTFSQGSSLCSSAMTNTCHLSLLFQSYMSTIIDPQAAFGQELFQL
ncbi:hypothetical protein ACFQZE_22615 [Paenibacillus sp. GCM10027627]